MKKLLLASLIFTLISCSDTTEREDQIIKKLVENSFSENWKENDKNRARILKLDVPVENYLWNACDTDICEKIIYHLKTLTILGNYNDKTWGEKKKEFRKKALKQLSNESSKERFIALKKIMVFGKIEDVKAVAPLLKDPSLRVATQAKGTLIQLGAPYRVELIKQDEINDEKLHNFIQYYISWYHKNKKKQREDVLWNRLQQPLPAHHKQTVVNGLIATLAASPDKKQFGADILWGMILKEINPDICNQQIILLGVLQDPTYIDRLLNTGWLSKGSIARRERVAWALNQMGFENHQPYE